MSWQQLIIEAPTDQAEAIADTLSEAGAEAVTFRDAGDEPLLEPPPGATPLWSRTLVVGLFDADVDLARVRARLPGTAARASRVETLAERDWSETWRETFGPMRFGRRLWVCPHGSESPSADAVVVWLDPGLAFGTGTHATTALCLEWLDGAALDGTRVIDYGCGSGILAIAAARLGAAEVCAIDNDPQALEATRANAEANGVSARIELRAADASAPAPADVVLANILAGVLVDRAGELAGLTRRGGALVLSGILADQEHAVRAAYAPQCARIDCAGREGWVRLDGRRA